MKDSGNAFPRQGGFSLVEVILALGLVAAVLVSTAGLFVVAGRQVDGGRKASEALSVARTIVEEMQGWGFHQTYQMYGFDGSATSYVADTLTNSFASKWQTMLDKELREGRATVSIASVGPDASPPSLDSTRAIRVTVEIEWKEMLRDRSVSLAIVRQ